MILFTYGTLQKEESRNEVLSIWHCKYLGEAKLRQYKIYHCIYGFPVIFPAKSMENKVIGELYELPVDEKDFDESNIGKLLNQIESEGTMYKKTKVLTSHLIGNKEIEAYAYIGIPNFWGYNTKYDAIIDNTYGCVNVTKVGKWHMDNFI